MEDRFNIFLINYQNDYCDNKGNAYRLGAEFDAYFLKKDITKFLQCYGNGMETNLFIIQEEYKPTPENIDISVPCLSKTWGSMLKQDVLDIMKLIPNNITITTKGGQLSFLSNYKDRSFKYSISRELYQANFCLFAGEYLDKQIITTVSDFIEIGKRLDIDPLPTIIASNRYSSFEEDTNVLSIHRKFEELDIRQQIPFLDE